MPGSENRTPEDRAIRLWQFADATYLDRTHRALATELEEMCAYEPEKAAHLIAALVQQNEDSHAH
jgi:hypothetical protein